jgi:Endonuclease NucS
MTKMWEIQDGKLVVVEQASLSKEETLEDWIAKDPAILGLELLIIGRQVITSYGKRIDLLGLDRTGKITILELKKDKTPRDVVAQILDYASWIRKLSTRDIYDIADKYLGKPLNEIFQKRFDSPIPENINSSHSMLIIASEFDESSKRIVEYLAEEHDVNINSAFFNIFKTGAQEFLTADWLMDQQEVEERAGEKKLPPWTGFWYVNVGDGDHRSWEDCRSFGFIAAGNGDAYSRPLFNLNVGDKIFAYQRGKGYVGYGIVTGTAVMAKDFEVTGGKLIEMYERKDVILKEPILFHDKDDEEMAEYLVGIDWKKSLPTESAHTFKGIFTNPNIVCKLRNPATLEFLQSRFNVLKNE